MNIYVGNLSYDVAEDGLRELFGEFGPIKSASIIQDRDSGRSKGFGFIEMEQKEDAEKAIQDLDGTSFGGRNLKVNEARPRNERPQRGNY